MKHPKPDRSNVIPNFTRSAEDPALDIGWNEGLLSNGRPYRLEYWTEDQVSSVTFFTSTSGLENCSNAQFADLLEREQVLRYRVGGRRSAAAMPFTDASGNSLWSVNVVVADDEETFADVLDPIRPYGHASPPPSLHAAATADEAWSALASSLADCLAVMDEDEFLVLSYKRATYYVQFAALGSYGMRMEASSNSFIEPQASLIDDQYRAMTALGWQRATTLPTDPDDPDRSESGDGSPNFFIDVGAPVNAIVLGQLAVTTLRHVYGITHPGMLQYVAFDSGGTSIRFPTLRLKNERK